MWDEIEGHDSCMDFCCACCYNEKVNSSCGSLIVSLILTAVWCSLSHKVEGLGEILKGNMRSNEKELVQDLSTLTFFIIFVF